MWLMFVMSLIIGILRFTVPGHSLSWPGTYEALVHIWVGLLIGFGLKGNDREPFALLSEKAMAWILLTVLTVLEIIMFIVQN